MNLSLATLFLFSIITLFYFLNNKEVLDFSNNYRYIFCILIVLLFFAIFRSPDGLSVDYSVYKEIFRLSNNSLEYLYSMFPQNDIGYLFINKIFRLFTDNFLILLVFIHTIIIGGFLYYFKKHSKHVWLSILLLITIGGYYITYNLMRQFLAISILLIFSDYLYNRKTVKYFIVVSCVALIHKSALIMIPFYTFSNINVYKNKKIFISFLILCSIAFLNFDFLLDLVQSFIYGNYNKNSFGMNTSSIFNLVRPSIILLFIMINIRNLNLNYSDSVININAILIGSIIMLFSMKLQIINRLYYYFLPYSLCLIPNIIPFFKRSKNYLYDNRKLWFMLLVIVLYCLVTQYNMEYNFIWNI